MARPFSTADIKKLQQDFQALEVKLMTAVDLYEHNKDEITTAIQEIRRKKVRELLLDVPVEEINRNHLGIPVRKLRANGYEMVADLVGEKPENLSAINGIGDQSANLILYEIDKIVEETADSVKLKINYDYQTPEVTNLIRAIYHFSHSYELLSTLNDFVNEHGDRINAALESIRCGSGFFKWIFASKEKKELAVAGYDYLKTLIDSGSIDTVTDILEEVDRERQTETPDVWEDFKKDPNAYYTKIEEIDPKLLGNDDVLYGLPEELARDVQAQELDLEGLSCTLRRYQELGVKYIIHQQRVLLGDEMGLGKTVQAIGAMVHLRNNGATHFVVVCPASVITNWCREIVKHSDLSVIRIHGTGRAVAFAKWIEEGGVAVTTYETTEYLHLEESFDFMVVDEAHYIKNPSAKRTMNVKRLCSHTNRLFFMTGTAIENKVEEMISLLHILQPKIGQDVKNITFLSGAPQFRKKVSPVYYRRKREDVLTELPELIEFKEWCDLNADEWSIYHTAILAKDYTLARRVSWNVPNINHCTKGKRMLEIVEEAKTEGRKVIIFSFFLDTIAKVTRLLEGSCVQAINGSVSPQRRQEIIDEFDKAPAGTVLPAQIQSGGTGLNIQSASVVIICEPQFKPSIENQAISRAYRMGQARNVLVYRLLADETIDERIMDLLADKQTIFDAFADESVAGDETLELDQATFSQMMEEERKKIEGEQQE